MSASTRAAKETPRALAAKERYAALPPSVRSLQRLAEDIEREQQALYEQWQAAGAQGKPPLVSKVAVIARQLANWSVTHHWQEFVANEDQRRAREQQQARDEALDALNVRDGDAAQTLKQAALQRAQEFLDADRRILANFQRRFDAAQRAYDEALARDEVEVAQKVRFPGRPYTFLSGRDLAQLAQLAFEQERLARGAATDLGDDAAKQGLPQVMVVNLTTTRPPEPHDPYEDAIPADPSPPLPPQEVGSLTPPALISLTTQPPPLPTAPKLGARNRRRGQVEDDDEDDPDRPAW